MTYILQI